MSEYRLSEAAQNDLREILEYTRASWGDRRAKHYLIELTLRFEELANFPGLGRKRENIGLGIRSFQASHHIVFYREKPEAIEIARILHPSMELERYFER